VITLIITLASITAYLATGATLAIRSLPRAWETARKHWGESMAPASVKGMTIAMFTLWPFYLSVLAFNSGLGRIIDRGDPRAVAEKIRQQQERIANLERELGIR